MKRLLILAAVALACLTTVQAQDRKQGKAEGEILALNREWADAMVRGDRAALERIFSDDLIVTSGRSEERRVGKECRSRWSPYH